MSINRQRTADDIIPLGWKIDKHGNEVPDEDEQELIAIVREYRDLGLNYSAIAQKLTNAGFTTRTGHAKFLKSAAKRIDNAETTEERLKREAFGYRRVDGQLVREESEQRVVSALSALKEAGYTYNEIGNELKKRGLL